MKINYYYHDDRIVVEVQPRNREEFEKAIKFIEFAQLNAENEYIKKEENEKDEH